MRYLKMFVLLSVYFVMAKPSFAQMTREEKNEKNEAREARINKKNDYAVFRRQMMGLKEYTAEKKKIPALQKENKGGAVKVVAFVDSNDNDEDAKTLLGYIRQDVGDNSTNMYEVTYDRATKKIVSVKRTPEAMDADKESAEDKEEKAADAKEGKKKISSKKSKDEDDDNDPDDEKPSKSHKEKDDE